jgi:hypothetical protein
LPRAHRVCEETTIVALQPALPDAEAFARALAVERRLNAQRLALRGRSQAVEVFEPRSASA